MEKRDLNISFYKAGNGGISTRINLPKKWVEKIGVSNEERGIKLILDEEKQTITIMKKK